MSTLSLSPSPALTPSSTKCCFAIAIFNEVSSLATILTTYISIFVSIIKMLSAGIRRKAFSTCASHLTTITMFHGTVLFLYCVPSSKNSWLMVKVGYIFYTVVSPMLNRLIYSLRNKDVKESVRKLIYHLIQFGWRFVCPKEIWSITVLIKSSCRDDDSNYAVNSLDHKFRDINWLFDLLASVQFSVK